MKKNDIMQLSLMNAFCACNEGQNRHRQAVSITPVADFDILVKCQAG